MNSDLANGIRKASELRMLCDYDCETYNPGLPTYRTAAEFFNQKQYGKVLDVTDERHILEGIGTVHSGPLDEVTFSLYLMQQALGEEAVVTADVLITPNVSHGEKLKGANPVKAVIYGRDRDNMYRIYRAYLRYQKLHESKLPEGEHAALEDRQMMVAGSFVFNVFHPDLPEHSSAYFRPILDMEVPATVVDIRVGANVVVEALRGLGVSFRVIYTGSSYSVIFEGILPYTPEVYGPVYGRILALLCDQSTDTGQVGYEFSKRIEAARSWEELHLIAKEVLEAFPSIHATKTREGVKADFRWWAYQTLAGTLFCRVFPAKRYTSSPQAVLDLY